MKNHPQFLPLKFLPRLEKSFLIFTMLLSVFSFKAVVAQVTYNNPESIVFDSIQKRYFVSNAGDGAIIQIDSTGETSYFNTELSSVRGLHIHDNVLYAASDNLVGFDLSSGAKVMDLYLSGSLFLNDITSDEAGNLYVTDSDIHRVYKVEIDAQIQSNFVTGGPISLPNGILYDSHDDRLLLCSYRMNSPIQSISLTDASVATVLETDYDNMDGLTADNIGNIYFSAWNQSAVYRVDREFTKPPELVVDGLVGPADIFFNTGTNELVIPNFNANEIVFEQIPDVYLHANFIANPVSGNAPATIQFRDVSYSGIPITAWRWDFDNDGTFDSQEQNPTWIYNEPGDYTVTLEVENDSLFQTITRANYIKMFSGETALQFDGSTVSAKASASPGLNLREATTVEAWIYPKGWGALAGLGFGRIVDKSNISLFLNGAGGSFNPHSLVLWLSTESSAPGYVHTPENSIALDQWQHVAATYDGTNNIVKVYINGVEQTLSQLAGQPAGSIKDNADIDLLIGNSVNNFGFNGVLDEIRIWNVVRSAGEIADNTDHYLKGSEPGLAGYWQMNEGSGTVIADGSGNMNNGEVAGAVWVEGIELNPPTPVCDNQVKTNLPDRFMLHQNYPNPFNPETWITYTLPRQSSVTMEIFNALGQRVTNENFAAQAPGTYRYKWSARSGKGGNLPSGVYICRMNAGGNIFHIKMVLLQ